MMIIKNGINKNINKTADPLPLRLHSAGAATAHAGK